MRKQKRIVNIGGVKIGGDNPVAIQSMCNTDTRDVKATVNQIHELENDWQSACLPWLSLT